MLRLYKVVCVTARFLLLTVFLCYSSDSLLALDWSDESYDDDQWTSGEGPLGFGSNIATSLTPGRITYYFRILVSIPDDYDLPIDRMYITIHSSDGIVVYFHGSEIGRSLSLPPGNLDATQRAAYHDSDGLQMFDASPILNACDHGIDGNFRSIAVEVHRIDPNEPTLRFDANVIAMSEGAEISLLNTGSLWAFDDSGIRPESVSVSPVHSIVFPVRGMPVVARPNDRIELQIISAALPDSAVCLLESRFCAVALPMEKSGVNPLNLDLFSVQLPSDFVPGVYDVFGIGPGFSEMVPGGLIVFSPPFDGNLSILHVTDSHIPFRGEGAPDNCADFQAVIDAANQMQPDLVIHTGDGYNEGDKRDQAERFVHMIREITSGFCYTPGNHELGEWCGTGDGRRNMWEFFGWNQLDPTQADHWPSGTRDWLFDLGPVSILFMESWVHYTDYWDGYYPETSFTSDQLAWLQYQAQTREDQAAVVLAYHHDFDDQLESMLPQLGVDVTLSGHTHQSSVDMSSGVLYLKTAATYGSSRPMRWLRFEAGELEEYPTLRSTAISINEELPANGHEDTIVITARNSESSAISGLKHWVRMRPSLDYKANQAEIIGQWDLSGSHLIGIEYNLEAGETRVMSIEPKTSAPNFQIWLEPTRSVFHAFDRAGLALNLIARWFPIDMELFIVIEAAGQYYFWPEWGTQADSITFRLPVGEYVGIELFNIEWPDVPLSGQRVTFHVAALDPRSGTLLRPVYSSSVLY